MNHIANETYIHGVKDAWHANRIGRVFFTFVFTICLVLMFFQLKGLFQAYINESVGTRLTSSTTLDEVEVPSFYYCNEMWYPNMLGLKELTRQEPRPPDLIKQMNTLYGGVRRNATVFPIDNHWRQMMIQDLVNGMLLLPDEGRFDQSYYAQQRPHYQSDPFYAGTYSEIVKMLQKMIGHSMRNTVLKKLGESLSDESSTQTAIAYQTHGIFPNKFDMTEEVAHPISYEPTYELITKLFNRTGNLTVSQDGICFGFSHGPERQKREQTDEKHRHVISHFGGFGRQLTTLMHMYLTTPGSHEISSGYTYTDMHSAVKRAIHKVLRYAMFYVHRYATYVSIAAHDEPRSFFEHKMRIDAYSPRVLIRYWTKKSVLKARNGFPCRPGWTALDQAHCNRNLGRQRGDLLCQPYLPASSNFQETAITNLSCIYDHTGLLAVIGKQAVKMNDGFPLKISSASRQQVLRNLTAYSNNCPRPCSRTEFEFETTFPTSSINSNNRMCLTALAYFFVPLEQMPDVWWGNHRLQVNEVFNQAAFKAFIWREAWSAIYKIARGSSTPDALWHGGRPCSVVYFERSETRGQISEEYFLYSLSDLAASVGGTVGLYIGASVLSIVQILYLSCLKKLFERAQLDWFNSRKIDGNMTSGHRKVQSQNNIPLRPTVCLYRAHPV